MSVGILATLFLFANNYLAYKPELTSFMVKFSGAILTSVLAVFGIIGWLVTPIYATQYQPNIIDHRSIQFIPSEDGDRGYEIAEIPFHFDVDFGQKLAISDASICRSERVQLPFVFSFFGDPYTDLFICDNGLVNFATFTYWDMEYKFFNVRHFRNGS